MLKDTITASQQLAGLARLYAVSHGFLRKPLTDDDRGLPPGWIPVSRWKSNAILKSWAAVVLRLLTGQTAGVKLAWMYVEYENVADEGNEVTIPEYGTDAEAGTEYYAGLSSHPTRDYLRVPVISGSIDVVDTDYPDGNLGRFFAETVGTVGVHGKAFSAAARSKVYGAALVAGSTVEADDLVFSRYYVESDEQTVKPENGPVGIQWKLTLRV